MAACMWAITASSSLSISHRIDQYGAYAGFAAVLGLAVLSLLYFAQAREVKRLREWAGRAPERAADLQERVQGDAARRVAPQPQAPAAQPGRPAIPPAAAAGIRPAAATPAGQAQGVPGAAAATAAGATAAGTATTPGASPGPGVPGPGAQPTTVQPAAGNGGPVPQAPPGQPLRVPAGTGTPPPRSPVAAEPEGHGRSLWAILGAAVAIVAVGLVLVFVVFGVGGGKDKSGTQAATSVPAADAGTGNSKTTAKGTTPAGVTPKPGTYVVAVLNGTAVPGLARGVATRLQNTKYKIGNVTNASDQTHSATLVQYAPGHLAEAQSVAKAIDVGRDAIQQVDSANRTIAGSQASVVVVVGADQNVSPQQQQTTP
jgi:hypothetical protein